MLLVLTLTILKTNITCITYKIICAFMYDTMYTTNEQSDRNLIIPNNHKKKFKERFANLRTKYCQSTDGLDFILTYFVLWVSISLNNFSISSFPMTPSAKN